MVVMDLPEALRRVLTRPVRVGTWQPVFTLLTTDADGTPRACLLSAIEVRCAGEELRVVVAGSRTRANLVAGRPAGLLVADEHAMHHCRLSVRRLDSGPPLAVAFTLAGHERDAVAGVELRPLCFQVTPELARHERWDRTAAALDRLAGA